MSRADAARRILAKHCKRCAAVVGLTHARRACNMRRRQIETLSRGLDERGDQLADPVDEHVARWILPFLDPAPFVDDGGEIAAFMEHRSRGGWCYRQKLSPERRALADLAAPVLAAMDAAERAALVEAVRENDSHFKRAA